MSNPTRARRDADLVAYYTREASDRARRDLPARRVAGRAAYLDLLVREGRRSVLEVGCGPGRDGQAFAAHGLGYAGVDLTPASVAACTSLGLRTCVASALRLPFPDGCFQAGWTMSTLMHLPLPDFEVAVAEVVRVMEPGAPLAIGVWGDERAHEGGWDDTRYGPPRFFSFRTDEQLVATLQRFGHVEDFQAWPGEGSVHYQWAVLRATAPG